MQIVTKLELTKERDQMETEDKIKEILFEMGKDIKIHKITSDNMILEIDYDKAVTKIMQLLKSSAYEQQ